MLKVSSLLLKNYSCNELDSNTKCSKYYSIMMDEAQEHKLVPMWKLAQSALRECNLNVRN